MLKVKPLEQTLCLTHCYGSFAQMDRNMTLFNSFDRAGLDRKYENRAEFSESAEISERWEAAGADVRKQFSADFDQFYGDHSHQCVDIFPAGKRDAPVLIFLHGGYWHMCDKSIAHFLVPTFIAADINFVSVGYRICPEVTVAATLDDIRMAIGWIKNNTPRFGGNPNRLYLAGHSAGGHFATLMGGSTGVPAGILKGICSISGLYDPEMTGVCFRTDIVSPAEKDMTAFSPMRLVQMVETAGLRLPPHLLTVGGLEAPEYLRQRDAFATALRDKRQPVECIDLPDRDHFTALEAFGDPHHPLCLAMLRLMLAPTF